VQAVLRRVNNDSEMLALDASIVLDEQQYSLRYAGQSLELTAVEFALFATLYRSPQQIFSRQRLMDSMYNDNRIVSERTIDSHIKKLRHKIEAAFIGIKLIHSVYAVGYKYEFQKLVEFA
jgi:two-component system response regulator BaeR